MSKAKQWLLYWKQLAQKLSFPTQEQKIENAKESVREGIEETLALIEHYQLELALKKARLVILTKWKAPKPKGKLCPSL